MVKAHMRTWSSEPEPEPEPPEPVHFSRSRSRSRRTVLLGAGAGAGAEMLPRSRSRSRSRPKMSRLRIPVYSICPHVLLVSDAMTDAAPVATTQLTQTTDTYNAIITRAMDVATGWTLGGNSYAGTREPGEGDSGGNLPHNLEAVGRRPPTLDCKCCSFLFLFVFARELGSLSKK